MVQLAGMTACLFFACVTYLRKCLVATLMVVSEEQVGGWHVTVQK